ncbi:MAG: formylmethanofuran dehydrogenase subunit A [Acetobacteraceae bacterium]|nr:formylmethanofuran dehydrogenase subunit A [Acetobacteraceae bacterium]
MLTALSGGRIIDPANGRDEQGDLFFEDGRIVPPPSDGRQPDETHNVLGSIVLAGGIDIHSHIAGTNVNTGRLLLPDLRGSGGRDAVPVTEQIGRLYIAMGFTTVIEPAISPHLAMQAHLELASIPFIDTAILTVLGNEDYLLELLRRKESTSAVADYAGRMLAGSQGLGLKVINAGGVAAFKENLRSFGLDDIVPHYGVTSRAIVRAAQKARELLGVPHPIHLHCNNLGLPGNVETVLATIAELGDRPLHLAHVQFYAYGKEGTRGFSSAAPQLAEAINARPQVTADVGQVMFGQTVTISSDVLRQFNGRAQSSPRKSAIMEREGSGGGVVPYRYRRNSFFNAVQWAAGLEIFLLVNDPWRLFFTTDHPNGAPFTAYPDLLALLMSRTLREQWIATVSAEAMEVSTLSSLAREYTWPEIATMTRAAPARLLGLSDRGHLGSGARADIAVYRPQADSAAMFRNAALVFKNGRLVVRDGQIPERVSGGVLRVRPDFDGAAADTRLAAWYDRVYGVPHSMFDVPADMTGRAGAFETVPCRS